LNNKQQGWLKIKSNLLAPSPKADRPARRKKNRNIRVSELKQYTYTYTLTHTHIKGVCIRACRNTGGVPYTAAAVYTHIIEKRYQNISVFNSPIKTGRLR